MSAPPQPPIIRLATPRDARRIAEIGAAAFRDLPIIRMLYPNSQTHYPSFIAARTSVMNRYMLIPRTRFLVAIDPATNSIMGYAWWTRYGDTRLAEHECELGPLASLEAALCNILDTAHDWLFAWTASTRDARARQEKGGRIREWMERYWEGLGMAERWYLESLVVAPEWRRRGVAGLLVEMGVGWARRERVVACLEATEQGKSTYERCGFVQVGEDKNEVEEVRLGTMMVCETEKFEMFE